MNVYPFIEAEEVEQYPVAPACRLLEVSRSAYYAWAAHRPSPRQLSDAELTKRIIKIHTDSRGTYGAPRVHAELAGQGIACGRKRVARLMAAKGLVGVCPRRYKTTTIADPAADPVVDLVKRAFGPGTIELDRVYVGDITYVRTWEGWLYLATVIDLASRRVVGWSMADHMRTQLVADALEALDHDAEQLDAQAHAQAAARENVDLTRKSYNEGNVAVLQVLDAERLYQNARLGYVRAQAQRYMDTVQLLLALGGSGP